RTDPDRRGADAGQLALLAAGPVPGRRQSAVVRQAIRPRLAGDDLLGQEQPAAGAAARGRRANPAEIPGGAGPAGRRRVMKGTAMGHANFWLFLALGLLFLWASESSGERRTPGPYRAGRSVVMAPHGMVAASHPLAAQIGLDVLKKGG